MISTSVNGDRFFPTPNEYWKLVDSYTVVQATLLILNIDPAGIEDIEGWVEDWKPIGFTALHTSLNNAVHEGTLTTNLMTNIDKNDLKNWLRSRKTTPEFFFDDNSQTIGTPDYLNKKHRYYSFKLAAAVLAWQAVTSNEEYMNNGKSPKNNLIDYLSENAEKLGLQTPDKEKNKKAIEEQIAMVANWNVKGGASTTPSR